MSGIFPEEGKKWVFLEKCSSSQQAPPVSTMMTEDHNFPWGGWQAPPQRLRKHTLSVTLTQEHWIQWALHEWKRKGFLNIQVPKSHGRWHKAFHSNGRAEARRHSWLRGLLNTTLSEDDKNTTHDIHLNTYYKGLALNALHTFTYLVLTTLAVGHCH